LTRLTHITPVTVQKSTLLFAKQGNDRTNAKFRKPESCRTDFVRSDKKIMLLIPEVAISKIDSVGRNSTERISMTSHNALWYRECLEDVHHLALGQRESTLGWPGAKKTAPTRGW
jgi:hypothetical protein